MFNPEKSILKWRKSLYRNPGLEDGMIEELESHLREEIERLIGQGLDAKSAPRLPSRGSIEKPTPVFSLRPSSIIPADSPRRWRSMSSSWACAE